VKASSEVKSEAETETVRSQYEELLKTGRTRHDELCGTYSNKGVSCFFVGIQNLIQSMRFTFYILQD
jgi:hypothetical protein